MLISPGQILLLFALSVFLSPVTQLHPICESKHQYHVKCVAAEGRTYQKHVGL
jgi:hypothetical protein